MKQKTHPNQNPQICNFKELLGDYSSTLFFSFSSLKSKLLALQ